MCFTLWNRVAIVYKIPRIFFLKYTTTKIYWNKIHWKYIETKNWFQYLLSLAWIWWNNYYNYCGRENPCRIHKICIFIVYKYTMDRYVGRYVYAFRAFPFWRPLSMVDRHSSGTQEIMMAVKRNFRQKKKP